MEAEARLEPGSLRKLLQASRNWDATARREMRAGLRLAAARGAEASKAEVLGPPPGGGAFGGETTGLRAALASGVKVAIRGGREAGGTVKGEGVRVTTTGTRLPEDQQAMVKAYMARTWRHPVYGTRYWVEQEGKNWFYGPLMRGRADYQRAVVAAINDAANAVAKG